MNEFDPTSGEPAQIGQYEVTGRIGRGSFGVVYRGRDPYLKRDVAIKVCTVDDEHLRQRFYREAEIAGKLEHDHVVAVHAFGFEGEAPYLVQEFLDGEDLSHLIGQRVAWSGRRKLDILAQIADALAYAHDQGVIHRDVKPANVRVLSVDPEVRIKLMDFGIAKLAHDESQLTQKGVTMGTASYLPPEQVKGGEVDHRGDIFSFGVLAYELFTLERPFRGQTLSALVYQILYKAPVKLEQVWPACPPELSAWVHRCLQKDPAARFSTFRELLTELEPIREDVASGRWPELDRVWLPGSPPESSVPESEGAEATSGVSPEVSLEAGVGSATRIMKAGPHDLDATQPVAAGPPETPPAPASHVESQESVEAVDSAATRRVPMPAIPGKPGETQDDIPEELRTSAHEISKLVEAGNLDAAMQQLEQTIHRHKGLASADGVTGVLPLPPSSSGAKATVQIDAERPTVEIPRATTEAARATQPPSPASTPPPPPSVATPAAVSAPVPRGAVGPPDPQLSRSSGAVPGVEAPESTAGLPPRTTAKAAGKGKSSGILIGAFAVAAVLAVIMGWWIGNERSDKTPIVETGLPPAPEIPVEAPATGLVVQATPWAYVAEVTNADGYTMELPEPPEAATTPLYLPLKPGEYTVIVRFPEGNAEQRCVVQVTDESSALCVTPFTQPTASDYFKDAGWWR